MIALLAEICVFTVSCLFSGLGCLIVAAYELWLGVVYGTLGLFAFCLGFA